MILPDEPAWFDSLGGSTIGLLRRDRDKGRRMDTRFEEVISTKHQLRKYVKQPGHFVANKAVDHIDDICRRYIAASPFVLVATRGADGMLDIAPKGDPAGFVHILDSKTLVIPDRLGNNRLDTFENLLASSEVGLFFIIPGHGNTLRVSGQGAIVWDRQLQERMAVNGKEPHLLLVVEVKEAMTYCPKCMTRSRIWKPEQWPDTSNVPTLAEAMIAHGNLSESVAKMQSVIERDGQTRLY